MKKLDDIHIDFSPIDGREKPINIIMTPRHDGKTTGFLMRKHWVAWKKSESPLVLLFRNMADIMPSSIDYYVNLMNEFMEKKIKLTYSAANCGKGIVTCFLNKKPFFHCVPLSMKEATLKKTAFPNVKYVLFDELEINPENHEKYLQNEWHKFQAYFDTQRKISDAKFYGLTNPYSYFNPYFSGLGVDTNKLKPGAMLVGPNYAVWLKVLHPDLLALIRKTDPLYSDEGDYAKMAFAGLPSNDANNHVRKMATGYHLDMLFSFNKKKYGLYVLNDLKDMINPYYYIKEERDNSKRRGIYAFEFEDLVNNSSLASVGDKSKFAHLKQAMRNQDVAFENIEAEYNFREIYKYI